MAPAALGDHSGASETLGRFTSSINVGSAMFCEVHEGECQDLS